ncbi:MAG: hypothetical protein U5J98_10290 [Halobacteriales archaeon]|nr:hypothetical protein [Halobacteriales archaeon]
MSTAERRPVQLAPTLDALPRFELDYGVDDRHEPTEVTIYDPLAADVTTSWLTADAAAAVDLADVA